MKKFRDLNARKLQSIHDRQDALGSAAITDEPSWRELLGPLLTIEDVQQRSGTSSVDVIKRLVRRRQILALTTNGGEMVFPAFQFDARGNVYPGISQIIGIFAPVVMTPYTIASWLKGPKDYLDGETPMRWLELGRDLEPVIAGAEAAAARLAH